VLEVPWDTFITRESAFAGADFTDSLIVLENWENMAAIEPVNILKIAIDEPLVDNIIVTMQMLEYEIEEVS
jgi:hypothetical protein